MNSQFIMFDYYIFGMKNTSKNKIDPKISGNAILYKLNYIKYYINLYKNYIIIQEMEYYIN